MPRAQDTPIQTLYETDKVHTTAYLSSPNYTILQLGSKSVHRYRDCYRYRYLIPIPMQNNVQCILE